MEPEISAGFRAGYIAMIGKPNVGKSTLLNALIGHKLSIVSSKPQTTRRKLLGVMHGDGFQIAFIDTPGVHDAHTTLGRHMIDEAREALGAVDLALVVCDASKRPDESDQRIAQMVVGQLPIYLCLNKMDKLRPEMVVDHVEAYQKLFKTEANMLTIATQGVNLEKLVAELVERLPEQEPMFDEDTFTDAPMRFLAAELIREKVLVATKQEVPHATAVVVTDWQDGKDLVEIRAEIVVEKSGQKAIIIGKKGQFLKQIGMAARQEIEEMVGKKVFLDLYVKVREDWRMNPRLVRELQDM
jgi:GTP-binding protein Era